MPIVHNNHKLKIYVYRLHFPLRPPIWLIASCNHLMEMSRLMYITCYIEVLHPIFFLKISLTVNSKISKFTDINVTSKLSYAIIFFESLLINKYFIHVSNFIQLYRHQVYRHQMSRLGSFCNHYS